MPKVPLMYDITIDERRPVTQDDINKNATFSQTVGIFLEGQDLLRSAFRATCAGQIQVSDFRDMILQMRSIIPEDGVLHYEKRLPRKDPA